MWKLVQNRSVVLQGPVGAFFASIGPAASTRVSVAAAVDDESRADSERMAVLTHTTSAETDGGMQVKTILNRLQKHRGFVYGTVQLEEQIAGLALTVEIAPHRRNRPRCASCGQASAVYDRLALRRFEFVPLWGLRVFFLYPMRRVDCPRCGVTVERVPWADGHQLTTTYMWFLARWAKCLSWQEVARVFRTSWDQVFRSVAMAVAWGRDHVDLTGIRAIGIDEIHWQRGSQFLTLVYQIDPTRKRLLWIGQHRRAKTLLRFFRWFGRERTAALAFICSDMWKAYLKVVAKKAGHALHILDRFHIAKHMSDAIDQVRRAEVRSLRQRGRQPLLTKARWVLLKRGRIRHPRSAPACASSSNTTCGRSAPCCCGNGSTTSGATGRSIGPGPSWTSGASKSCARASSR